MPTIVYDHGIFSRQPVGGISRYFCEIAARVAREPGWCARVVAPLHYNEHLAESSVHRFGCYVRLRNPRTARLYRATNALLGTPLLAARGTDVVHRTYYTPRPRPPRGRLVVTVFDMIHELYPHNFQPEDPVRSLKRLCVAAADHVICISHSTAADLVRLLEVSRHKISVTHLGLSDAFTAAGSSEAPAVEPARRPYLLYVGHRGGYKNFARLLEAYAASPELRADFDLVTFGGHPFGADEALRIAALGLRPDAVRHQAGSDVDLARAYARAHLFVYPSEYEGFGIPPLEAMSCGCPVVCSRSSSLPEVVGAAADYFDPTSVDAIRAALERVAGDESRRAKLVAAGHVRCRAFSWDRCAAETRSIYRAVLAA